MQQNDCSGVARLADHKVAKVEVAKTISVDREVAASARLAQRSCLGIKVRLASSCYHLCQLVRLVARHLRHWRLRCPISYEDGQGVTLDDRRGRYTAKMSSLNAKLSIELVQEQATAQSLSEMGRGERCLFALICLSFF